MPPGVTTTIVLDRDTWNALTQRCDTLHLSLSEYFEHLFHAQFAERSGQQGEPPHEQALLQVELALAYGHLVRTYGDEAVSKAHHRYLVERRVNANGENTFDDLANAIGPQRKRLDAEQLLVLATQYDDLVTQFGSENVDRCHDFLTAVRKA
jgi:hypothetical protein